VGQPLKFRFFHRGKKLPSWIRHFLFHDGNSGIHGGKFRRQSKQNLNIILKITFISPKKRPMVLLNYNYFIFHSSRSKIQRHFQLWTKIYFKMLLSAHLLACGKTKTFMISGSDCRLLKRRKYFMQTCFIVNNNSEKSSRLLTVHHVFLGQWLKYISCRSRW
jgi:hypothetical protein